MAEGTHGERMQESKIPVSLPTVSGFFTIALSKNIL